MRLIRSPLALLVYTDRLVPSGSDSFTPGPVILMRPPCADDHALLEHELTHVRQFWRSCGVLTLLWLVSKRWRLRLEVEAYRVQIACYPLDRQHWVRDTCAIRLANGYRLGITTEEAKALLT